MVSVTYEPTDEEIVPYLSPTATYTELKQWIEEKYHTSILEHVNYCLSLISQV